jgi:Zn finger protein HypA/HybF involved in hydrogenase expression
MTMRETKCEKCGYQAIINRDDLKCSKCGGELEILASEIKEEVQSDKRNKN